MDFDDGILYSGVVIVAESILSTTIYYVGTSGSGFSNSSIEAGVC